MAGKLTLSFTPDDSYGAKPVVMVLPIDDHTVREFMDIKPPPDIPGAMSFDDVVETLKRKEFRKKFFVAECTRIGALLAERMEDADGWHDASRIEPARRELGLRR